MIPLLPGALSRWVAGVLVVAMAGSVVGWRVRDRIADGVEARLQARIGELERIAERLTERAEGWRRDYQTARRNAEVLEVALAGQSAEVERLGRAYATAERRRLEVAARLAEYLARPVEPVVIQPGTCEDMVERARAAGGQP
jgi:hypothetical protein